MTEQDSAELESTRAVKLIVLTAKKTEQKSGYSEYAEPNFQTLDCRALAEFRTSLRGLSPEECRCWDKNLSSKNSMLF